MDSNKNNIGFLRLLFASFVIIGHSPELLDGNRNREPLSMIFHTISLGDLAVDGFFLLSGFLITKSMVNSRSFCRFLERRVFRIYPAFIVAFLLSVFVLGPIVGARPWLQLGQTIYRLVTLQQPPYYPGQLQGFAYQLLNGAMWTIQYEFRCYLLIGLLGVLGLLKRRWLMLGLTVLFMTAHILATFPWVTVCLDALHDRAAALFGDRALTLIGADSPQLTIRFTAVFLVGSCFYLFRNEVETKLTSTTAVSCGFLAAVFMYRDPHFAEASLTTLGAFTLFWVAFKASIGPLQKINHSWDISYGVYLYGWPIATYFRWAHPSISPWTLATLTFLVALVFGSISWFALEKWTKDLVLCPSARALKID